MRITHHTPRPGTQTFLGVTFRDGVAVVDVLHHYTREALIFHGFTVEEDAPVKPAAETDTGLVDLQTLDRKQLLELVPEGVTVPARASRDKLIEIIGDHYTPEPIPGSVDNGDGTFTHPGHPEFFNYERAGESFIPGGD